MMEQATPVVHLVVSLAHGGLERLVVDWTNARNRRWPGSTRVVCLDEPGDLAPQVEGARVVCLHANRSRAPWDRRAVARLKKWISEQLAVNSEQLAVSSGGGTSGSQCRTSTVHRPLFTVHSLLPAVLHAHNLAAWQYAVLAARGIGARVVFTQHGANLHNRRFKDRLRCRLLACLTDEIVAVSAATADAMAREQWIPRRRIAVIENGVETGRVLGEGVGVQGSGVRGQEGAGGEAATSVRQPIRAAFGLPAEAVVLGSVGRLAHVKGYDRLIAALAAGRPTVERGALPDKGHLPSIADFPRFTPYLLLVGDGPDRGALEEQARALGVADRVRFAGFQASPADFLAAMDAFVLPSRSEGLSISLLEAMAAGVPAFVTDVGASRAVIDDGACGTLLPEDNAAWLAIVGAQLAPGGRAAVLADRARERVAGRYSLEATLEAYEGVYQGRSAPQ